MRRLRIPMAPIVSLVAALIMATGCESVVSILEDELSQPEASTPTDGLREALRVGTERAVSKLGVAGGYLESPDVRIDMPERLEVLEKALSLIGERDLVDEFVTSMNRSAEAAAPLARPVFVDVVMKMTFDDAMAILRGQEHEATDYLAEHARPRLKEVFRPVVESKLDQVGTTRAFNDLMKRYLELPMVGKPAFELSDYVTDKALDGLFLMIAREEERIRDDPLARTTELLRRYFGDRAPTL